MNPDFLSPLAEKIFDCRLVKSGAVADVWKIALDTGIYCIKHYTDQYARLRQQAELKDLKLLSEVLTDSIPGINDELAEQFEGAVIWLDWIESGPSGSRSQKTAAAVLADLHQKTSVSAGLQYTNYIGELTQYNEPGSNWATFWVEQRMMPQVHLAIENGLLQQEELKSLERYTSKVPAYLPGISSFSLLHGDLWNGNVLNDKEGKVFLIDPAVYYGDPWVDLAMTALFGGFDQTFYDAYFERSPVDPKGKALVPHYQLYYLLVHLNMFGRSYYPDIQRIARRYV